MRTSVARSLTRNPVLLLELGFFIFSDAPGACLSENSSSWSPSQAKYRIKRETPSTFSYTCQWPVHRRTSMRESGRRSCRSVTTFTGEVLSSSPVIRRTGIVNFSTAMGDVVAIAMQALAYPSGVVERSDARTAAYATGW